MQLSKTFMIVAVALALVIGLVVFAHVASADRSPNALEKYLQATFGCNEKYRGISTPKQVHPKAFLSCKTQAERRYWKDVDKEFHKDLLGKPEALKELYETFASCLKNKVPAT